jgi:DMSO/TMAO reductase YedYZ molybdopterin-dependent catalytic subunit
VLCAFLAFGVIHVAMVVATGLARNMNHITVGGDSADALGLIVGLAGIIVIIAVNAAANWLAWRRPRLVQHAAKRMVTPIIRLLFGRGAPRAQFRPADISPYFWINGAVPRSEEWLRLEADGFRSYRLRVHGAVRRPLEPSLDDLRRLGMRSQITLHHCIQGWSGIAEWHGIPLASVLTAAEPLPSATAVVFRSFGDGVAIDHPELSERYYDSLPLVDARHPQTLLALEMNGRPLDRFHGAPLRLRVENQLGFKMVKWIEAIEIVEDIRRIRGGEGGFAEDREYFGDVANI